MFSQMILPGFDKFTSSQESVAGHTPCDSPELTTTNQCGPDHVHASLLAPLANKKERQTNGTSGPKFSGSSASVALQQSLASRLRQRFDSAGSMEYAETWKEKATPLGFTYWAHTASGRRTSDSESTGWPTPKHQEDGRTWDQYQAARLRGYEARKGKTCGGPASEQGGLAIAVQTVGWPTPMAATPAQNGNNAAGNCDYSRTVEAAMGLRPSKNEPMSGWATPTANEKVRSEAFQQGRELNAREALGATHESPPAETASSVGYRLSPKFSLWLMGYPIAWARCAERVTPSSRKSRQSSSKRSTKTPTTGANP